jgi:hypothetical protein
MRVDHVATGGHQGRTATHNDDERRPERDTDRHRCAGHARASLPGAGGAYDGPVEELILAPGEGLSVENPMGGLFTFKITSDKSDGALTAIETFILRHEGPPLHVHDKTR